MAENVAAEGRLEGKPPQALPPGLNAVDDEHGCAGGAGETEVDEGEGAAATDDDDGRDSTPSSRPSSLAKSARHATMLSRHDLNSSAFDIFSALSSCSSRDTSSPRALIVSDILL